MKKLRFISLILLLAACQEGTVTENKVDFSKVATSLESVYQDAFSVALASKPENVFSNTFAQLKDNYFKINIDVDMLEVQKQIALAGRVKTSDDLDLSFLSQSQISLVAPLLNDLLDQEDLSEASQKTSAFIDQVLISSLSDEEKYQLLAIGIGIKSGIQTLFNITSSNAKQQGEVNVKNALRAGVVSLATGAIAGCYGGATAGTFTVPILGTAAGCVGGAVFGGAAGFVSGVGMSILQDLLFD